MAAPLILYLQKTEKYSTLRDQKGKIIFPPTMPHHNGIFDIGDQLFTVSLKTVHEGSYVQKNGQEIGTIVVARSLSSFFESLITLAKKLLVLLVPLVTFAIFIVFYLDRRMVRLANSLQEKISDARIVQNICTRLATARDLPALQNISSMGMTELFPDASVEVYCQDAPPPANDKPSGIENVSNKLHIWQCETRSKYDHAPSLLVRISFSTPPDEHKNILLSTLHANLQLGIENENFLLEERISAEQNAERNAELKAVQLLYEALIPRHIAFPGLEFGHHFAPADSTGGDWFGSYYEKIGNVYYFFIGDVTGHGIPAAITTAVACGAIYSGEMRADLIAEPSTVSTPPEKRLRHIAEVANEVILQTGKGERLMTMLFCALEMESGKLFILNAGHPLPLIRRAESALLNCYPCKGSRLGFAKPGKFEVIETHLEPGDVLFLFTDGLVENRGPDDEIFAMRHLKRILTQESTPQTMIQEILKNTRTLWKDAKAEDDVSIVAIRWNGSASKDWILENLHKI
jgi:serine phosphatase RsbU (regulator of sigma subunit)